jgi:hypothetical protein
MASLTETNHVVRISRSFWPQVLWVYMMNLNVFFSVAPRTRLNYNAPFACTSYSAADAQRHQ